MMKSPPISLGNLYEFKTSSNDSSDSFFSAFTTKTYLLAKKWIVSITFLFNQDSRPHCRRGCCCCCNQMLVGRGVGEYWDSEKDGFSKATHIFFGKEGTGESAFQVNVSECWQVAS